MPPQSLQINQFDYNSNTLFFVLPVEIKLRLRNNAIVMFGRNYVISTNLEEKQIESRPPLTVEQGSDAEPDDDHESDDLAREKEDVEATNERDAVAVE